MRLSGPHSLKKRHEVGQAAGVNNEPIFFDGGLLDERKTLASLAISWSLFT